MKIKIFMATLALAVGTGTLAFASEPDIYVRWTNDTGFIITSDTDMSVKLVVSDYDDEGRLINAHTDITDINIGDNAYAYDDFGAGNTDAHREILIWKGEENSIEPISSMPLLHPEETVEYAESYVRAADNGLLDGVGAIKLSEPITKSQIKTIITNAMGGFVIDTNENFDSDENITCAHTYRVLAKVFGLDWYTVNYMSGKKEYIGKSDTAVLDTFTDKDSVAGYTDYAAVIVERGGFTGFDGQLKGDSYITAGEFMYLMDELVGTYIDEPGEYTSSDYDADRSIIVRKGGVTIDALTTDKNLIIAYSVDTSGVVIKDSVVTGTTSIMGCADPENKKSCISLGGIFYDVRVGREWVTVNASGADIEYYRGTKNSTVNMGMF